MKWMSVGFAVISLTLFSACKHGPNTEQGSREPSAIVATIPVETSLSEITAAQKTVDETEALAISLVKMYYVSQDYLRAFDDKLDYALANKTATNNVDMMTTSQYANLLSIRIFSDMATDKIIGQYEKLLLSYKEAKLANQDTAAILNEISHFKMTLSSPALILGPNRVALQELAQMLNQVPAQIFADIKGPALVSLAELNVFPSNFMFKSGKDIDSYMRIAENKKEFKERVAEAMAQDKIIQNSVAKISPYILSNLEEDRANREPQSIGPGMGANGNINGGNFPSRTWALTFDDGPSGYTIPILNNLQKNAIKASFFWLAKNVASPSNARAIAAAKAAFMDLNNHSYSHANLANLGADGLRREIVQSSAIEASYYGSRGAPAPPKYFRCPYGSGANTARVRSVIAQQGMVHVFWNVDSLDWRDHNAASIVARTRKQMQQQGHGIILFHDIHPQSVTASNVIMGDLKALRARTIAQVVQELNGR